MSVPGKKVIRAAFYDRLRMAFFSYLKNVPLLKDWQFTQLMTLSQSIINAKITEINSFLDSQNFTLKQTDEAINIIIKDYLAPEIDNIRL